MSDPILPINDGLSFNEYDNELGDNNEATYEEDVFGEYGDLWNVAH